MTTFGEALNQARQLLVAGQLPQAEAIYRRLLEAVPQAADPWHEMGLLQLQAKRPEAAVECLRRAIAIDPNTPAYHSNLGAAYRMLKQPVEAIASFERALQMGPATAELYNNCALARKDVGQADAALSAFDEALRIRPEYANGHFNRGNLLVEMGRLDEAVGSYRRAIQFAPEDAAAHCKLGMALYDLGRLDEAMACFEQSLVIQPNYPEARRNRACYWLARGEYSKGWLEAEWRLECADSGKWSFLQPRWDGSPLAGRTLLVYAEQGLGDTLQFIRYIPLVEKSGGRVLVQVQGALVPLLTQSDFGRWLTTPAAAASFEIQSPLMSLAGLLKDLKGQPYWERPYLAADPKLVARWEARLRDIRGFKIGIVWAGNPEMAQDRYRSVHLAQFAPLADVPGVRLINLQKGGPCQQLAEMAGRLDVINLGDDLDATGGAFMDTAAVIKHLDLVIAVDTSVAHLAGGLGVKVWVPLNFSPDWRWLDHGHQTPWYPTMRLFRQSEFDRWPGVFEEMAGALRPLVAAKSP